jgi:hypothetical protein
MKNYFSPKYMFNPFKHHIKANEKSPPLAKHFRCAPFLSIQTGWPEEQYLGASNYYLAMFQVPSDTKTLQAHVKFYGEAFEWYRGYNATHDHPPSWYFW